MTNLRLKMATLDRNPKSEDGNPDFEAENGIFEVEILLFEAENADLNPKAR